MDIGRNITNSYLDVDRLIGSFESSVIIKKKIEMYTKRFARVFDIEKNGFSNKAYQFKSIRPRKIANIENSEKFNVVENIVIISPNSGENEILTNCLLGNQYRNEKYFTDDTQENNVNVIDKDTYRWKDANEKSEKDYMKRLEVFLYDFDKANSTVRKEPQKDLKDTYMEMINSSRSSDGNGEKENGDHNENSREKDLASIISDNCLLEKSVEQLRIKFKQFFTDLDMKNDTFKIPKVDQNYPQSSEKKTYNETKTYIAKKDNKMSVVDIIEQSRLATGKQPIIYQNFHNNQQLEKPQRHFNNDGFCMKSNSLSTTTNVSIDTEKLRKRSVKFLRVFSKMDQFVNSLIPIPPSSKPLTLRNITGRESHDKEKAPDSVEDSYLSTSKIVRVEDKECKRASSDTNQPVFNSNRFTSRKRIPRYIPSRGVCKLSAKPEKSLHPIEEPEKSTKMISKYHAQSGSSGGSSLPPIEVPEKSTRRINKYHAKTGSSGSSPKMISKYHAQSGSSGGSSLPPIEVPEKSTRRINKYHAKTGSSGSSPLPPIEVPEKSTRRINKYHAKAGSSGGSSLPPIEVPEKSTRMIHKYHVKTVNSGDSSLTSNRRNIGKTSRVRNASPRKQIWKKKNSMYRATKNNSSLSVLSCGEIDITGATLDISETMSSEISSRNDTSMLDQSIDFTSSTETASESSHSRCSPNDFNKYTGTALGVTYLNTNPFNNFPASPTGKPLLTKNSQEDEEVPDGLGQHVRTTRFRRRVKRRPTKNIPLSKKQSQKRSNMHSLPVVVDEPINIDQSETVSGRICKNLQSTCMYFDEKKDITEFVAVMLPDIKDELEKVGKYEDFEKDLLINTRLTSESNKTI